MNSDIKSMGLLAQLTKGLLLHSRKETETQLGDRSQYIGMSDIGKGSECMRSAVANKVYGSNQPHPDDILKWYKDADYDKIRDALNKELILQRGHWLEAGILSAFEANSANIIPQLEIATNLPRHQRSENDATCGRPVAAHLDFVLVWGGNHPAVRVLELKSTENIPKFLYSSYELQIYGQLGFLCQCWNQPCFNNKTFPQYVKDRFKITLPNDPKAVDIEGWVLCLAMSDAKAIGPYKPNEAMLKFCEKTAATIWTKSEEIRHNKISLNDVEYCKGFHPLCDWCSYAKDCPKFTSVELNDPYYNDALAELEELKKQKSKLEDEIAVTERRVRDFYLNSGIQNDWLATEDYRFKCSTIEGRKTLNEEILSSKLTDLHGLKKAEQIIEQSKKHGESYTRLYVNKTNREI